MSVIYFCQGLSCCPDFWGVYKVRLGCILLWQKFTHDLNDRETGNHHWNPFLTLVITDHIISGLSKVAGCQQKPLSTWLVSAGYSAWHFFMDGVKYSWTGRLLWQLDQPSISKNFLTTLNFWVMLYFHSIKPHRFLNLYPVLCLFQTWPIALQCICSMRYLDFVCPPNKVFHTLYWQCILQTEENLSLFGIWTNYKYMFWLFSFRLVIHDVLLLMWLKNRCFHSFFLPALDKSIVTNA